MQLAFDLVLAAYLGLVGLLAWLVRSHSTCLVVAHGGEAGLVTLFAGPAAEAPAAPSERLLELHVSAGPALATTLCLLGAVGLTIGLPFDAAAVGFGLLGLAFYLMARNAAAVLRDWREQDGVLGEDGLDVWSVLPSLVALPMLLAGLRLA